MSFYFSLFAYFGGGGVTTPQSFKILGCSSSIALVFGCVLEDRKIRNRCSFILACLHIQVVKLPTKFHENRWCHPPIALVFRYVLVDRKIRNRCLFILVCLHIFLGGVTTPQSFKICSGSSPIALAKNQSNPRWAPPILMKFERWFHP